MTRPPAMIDNPAWAHHTTHRAHRTLGTGPGTCTIDAVFDPAAGFWQLQSQLPAPARTQLAEFRTADLGLRVPSAIRRALAPLDGLQRLGAGSCWEALGTAVIRQVIRAGQARKVWHQLSTALTPPATATASAFPSEQRFLAASDAQLAAVGLGFKARRLRTLAEACLAETTAWDQLNDADLHDRWLALPGIGPWSAGAAIADLRNAWQFYPHDDLAVRTWASRAFPDARIPSDPKPFLTRWTQWGGATVGTLTAFTLGWSATCPT